MNNGTVVSRRWLLGGVAISTGATIVSMTAIALVLKNVAANGLGQAIKTSDPITIGAAKAKSGKLGMNLSPPSYYSNTHPFLNRIRTAGAFAADGPVDSDGYPTSARPAGGNTAWTLFSIEPKTTGISNRWLIISNGTMPVTITAQNGTANTLVDGSNPRRMVYDYNDTAYSQCRIDIDFSGGGTRPTLLAIVRSDQEALYSSGEIFNPAFVAACSQWTALRFMDWLNTNYKNPGTPQTGNTSWASRPSQNYLTWCTTNPATGEGGVPPEVCAALCVKAGCDMWYNVPFKYARADWQAAITYLKSALGSQKLHVEYSNEVWNYTFQQTSDAQTLGAATTINGSPGGIRTYYGQQVCRIAQDAVTIYAGSRNQLVTHLAVQEVNTTTYTDAEVGFQNLGYEVAQLIDEVSGTFYIDGGIVTSDAASGTSSTQKTTILNLANAVNAGGAGAATALNTVFAQIHDGGQSGFTVNTLPTIVSHKANTDAWASLANSKGWEFGTYEGQLYHWPIGNSGWTTAEQAVLVQFVKIVISDARTAAYINEVLSYDRAKVRGTFTVFNDLGATDIYGDWGTKAQLYDIDTVRQTAYKSF